MALLGAALTATLALAGCSASVPVEPESSVSTDAGFPLTMQNACGEITINAKPDRVVALGFSDLAIASALGANVVGAVQSYGSISGETDDKNLPYAEPLSDDVVWLNPMDLNVEQIAALRPDVILANAAFMLDEPSYLLLNDVAPVVTYEEGIYEATARDEALRIGMALGEEAGAEALVKEADAAVAASRDEFPTLEGRSYLYGQARDGVVVMVIDNTNATAEFMSRLGLAPLPTVATLEGKGSAPGTIDVSFEQAGLFEDAGALFMTYQSEALQDQFENDPVVSSLDIMKNRYFPLGAEAATALQAPNVVAVPWLLDQLHDGLAAIAK